MMFSARYSCQTVMYLIIIVWDQASCLSKIEWCSSYVEKEPLFARRDSQLAVVATQASQSVVNVMYSGNAT